MTGEGRTHQKCVRPSLLLPGFSGYLTPMAAEITIRCTSLVPS